MKLLSPTAILTALFLSGLINAETAGAQPPEAKYKEGAYYLVEAALPLRLL